MIDLSYQEAVQQIFEEMKAVIQRWADAMQRWAYRLDDEQARLLILVLPDSAQWLLGTPRHRRLTYRRRPKRRSSRRLAVQAKRARLDLDIYGKPI